MTPQVEKRECHRSGQVSPQVSSVGGSSGDTRPMTLPSEKMVHCQSSRNFGRSRYESILGDSDNTSDSVIGVSNPGASDVVAPERPDTVTGFRELR
jgi:hypothetical protein